MQGKFCLINARNAWGAYYVKCWASWVPSLLQAGYVGSSGSTGDHIHKSSIRFRVGGVNPVPKTLHLT